MFTAKNVYIEIDVKELEKSVTEYEIFKKYCTNFEQLNKSFLSDLYTDSRPSCRIFKGANGRLIYNDFGKPEHYFGCYDYLQAKFNVSFKEVLRIVANDFGLLKITPESKPKFLLGEEKMEVLEQEKEQVKINIYKREWNLWDMYYWKRFRIGFNDLDAEEVIPLTKYDLIKDDNTLTFYNTNQNPIYAYTERNWETGEFLGYKIYSPLNIKKEYRFISCTDVSKSIIGWHSLPKTGDMVILTKSRKDVMCLKALGYSAFSLQSEGTPVPEFIANDVKRRFKKVYVLYDNDSTGIFMSNNICKKYGFVNLNIDYPTTNSKDISEYISKHSSQQTEDYLKKLINGSN